ncbi:hypothetical protein, partial [Tepidiforma sp.]|uniref:hypothetical protein n=1 Tax=Tepidiforma sp. TaxID=2682230 RepID=UPI002629FEF1
WRDLEPAPGAYAWDRVEAWLDTVSGYGKKGIIRIVLRCEDVAVSSSRWNSGQRGDICAPAWAVTSAYQPVSVDLSGLPDACLQIAQPMRLNFLAQPVT